jgi:hypothetical protein
VNASSPFLKSSLATVFTLLMVVDALMTALSLAGLLFAMVMYPDEELRQSFIANDVVNLVIGLPVLLWALWFACRGKLPGLLGLPGTLFYETYNSIAYAAAMPLTWPFFAHLALSGLSAVAIFRHLSSLDGAAVQAQLQGHRFPHCFRVLRIQRGTHGKVAVYHFCIVVAAQFTQCFGQIIHHESVMVGEELHVHLGRFPAG